MKACDDGDDDLELALMGRVWEFSRGDGSVISRQFRLRRGGAIDGHKHPNEVSWRVHEGMLEFADAKGIVTTRFEPARRDEHGIMTLHGRFIAKAGVRHILRELRSCMRQGPANVDPRVALLVRTHVVNDKLFDLLDVLNQSRRYDLFVSADESGGGLAVPGYDKLPHTVDTCAQFGLSTQHEQLLWHCGDYPLYFAAADLPDYDYYAMIEYDVDLVRKSPLVVEGLISRLRHSGNRSADLVSQHTNRAWPHWPWAKAASRLFSPVYTTGIFAFVIASKRALNHLLELRRQEARSGVTGDDIVHCEAFCGSALIAGGFACEPFNSLLQGVLDNESFHPSDPERPDTHHLLGRYRVDDPRVELVHPVYDLEGYLDRLLGYAMNHNEIDAFLAKLDLIDRSRAKDAELVARLRDVALGAMSDV